MRCASSTPRCAEEYAEAGTQDYVQKPRCEKKDERERVYPEYIRYKADEIVDSVFSKNGTNTEARCCVIWIRDFKSSWNPMLMQGHLRNADAFAKTLHFLQGR